MSELPEALQNCTEAVALSFDGVSAPTLSAKTDGDLTHALLALAVEHNVPIYENAELSHWLSQLDLGDEIPQTLYQVIAEILAFVYHLEGKSPI